VRYLLCVNTHDQMIQIATYVSELKVALRRHKKKYYLVLRFIKALYSFNFFPTFVVLVTLNARSDYSNALKSGLLVW